MQRRNFIKNGCMYCMAIAGSSMLLSLLESCSPLPVYKTTSENKTLRIPIEQFGLNDFLIVRASDVEYDIAIIKNSETEYLSLIMLCTHADNPVRFSGKEFTCNLHGSVFSRSGGIEKGPAEIPLRTLTTIKENNNLIINLS